MKLLVNIIFALSIFVACLQAKDKKVYTLIVHHFNNTSSTNHLDLMLWKKKLSKMSKGRIKLDIYPSMTLGGKPTELYKQVRDGTVDIALIVAGYNPGVFWRTEVFTLPSVRKNSALAVSMAMKDRFDLIKDDYKDVKPLLLQSILGELVHTIDKKITSLKDMEGLKIRTPNRIGSYYIQELGAQAVAMPMPEVPQALLKKVVDGIYAPYEAFIPFKFYNLTKYSIEGGNLNSVGATFSLLMNKKRFNSLPKDLQKIIEKSVNMYTVRIWSKRWMDAENVGRNLQKKSKDTQMIQLSKKATKEFNEAALRVTQRWIKEVNKKGIDGEKLVEEATKAVLKYANETSNE